MLVDTFLYHDEVAMLELRVRALGDVVDLFLAVTCSVSHQGEPRAVALPSLPVDNIILHEVSAAIEHPEGYTLGVNGERGGAQSNLYQFVERQHRSGIVDAVRAAHVTDPNTLVMVSDVDEIPALDAISDQGVLQARVGNDWLVFEMRNHSTALDLLNPKQPELTTTIARLAYLQPQAMRDARGPLFAAGRTIPDAGIHLSWFGTDEVRQRKLDSFSHAELRGVYNPADGRRNHRHANDEPLRKLTPEEMRQMPWPKPLTDGTFVIPDEWWDDGPVPLADPAHESAA